MTFAGTSAAPVLRLSIRRTGFGSMVMGLLDRIEEKDCDSCVIDLSYFNGAASQESVFAIGPSKVMSAALCDSYLRAISTRNLPPMQCSGGRLLTPFQPLQLVSTAIW